MTQITTYKKIYALRSTIKDSSTVVLVTGVFDLLHSEHQKLLTKAKALGDVLLVGLEPDKRVKNLKGKNRPINPTTTRSKDLASLNLADYVFELPNNLDTKQGREVFIKKLLPHILAISASTPHLPEKRRLMKLVSGKVKTVLSHNPSISTSKLIKSSLKISDPIYGKTIITEPVLIELIKSKPLQRLKKIAQCGIPDKYYFLKNFYRFEHSLGVMILLKKLNASLEEQVAGLIHDVSTLAFSHVTDWVFGQGQHGVEDYHDSLHSRFIKKTSIPQILKKHHFSLKKILNEKNFTLLENDIPNLCADRFDYALRELKHYYRVSIAKTCLNSLTSFKEEIVFKDPKAAHTFATHFLFLQLKHWGSYQAVKRYSLFSKALKLALKDKTISKSDFFNHDNFVLKKLEETTNPEIKSTLSLLKHKNLEKLNLSTTTKVTKKFRHVDPKVLVNSKLIRLSQLNPKFKSLLQKHRLQNQKGISV